MSGRLTLSKEGPLISTPHISASSAMNKCSYLACSQSAALANVPCSGSNPCGCTFGPNGANREVYWFVCLASFTARIKCSQVIAGTMFELVKALEDGAEELKIRVPNPISLNAGCELFIAFVTLFPHESQVRVIYSSCCIFRRQLTGRRVFQNSGESSSTKVRRTQQKRSRTVIRLHVSPLTSSRTIPW